MSKIVFCGDLRFPHGSASANYVQNVASAFFEIGFEVIICSTVNNHELQNLDKKISNKFIIYPLQDLGGGIKRIIQLKRYFLPQLKKYLDNMNLSNEDFVVSYAITPQINDFVLKYSKKNSIKTIACPVEWFDSSRYKAKILSPHYLVFAKSFYFQYPKFDYILSISTHIQDYFVSRGSNTFKLPFVVDTSEFRMEKRFNMAKVKIVYAGSIGEKGDFSSLVNALDKLEPNEINQIEIHMTRVTREKVDSYLSDKLKENSCEIFIIHDNLDYHQLIDLYNQMHYLYIVRKESKATLSNFPSKGPEAMTYGVVPVATKLGDFEKEYLLDEINSIIINEPNVKNVYMALIRILRKPLLDYKNLSLNAIDTVKKKLDYTRWTDELKRFINKGND